METETIALEAIISEILSMPNNHYPKEELEKKTYTELLDIQAELYTFT